MKEQPSPRKKKTYRKPENKTCPYCGSNFERENNISEKSWNKIKYCSDKCRENVCGQSVDSKTKERSRKIARNWYLKNQDIIKEKRRIRYLQNKNREIESSKKYYKKNKDKISEYSKRWSEKNKERLKILNRIWTKNNPEKVKATIQRYKIKNKEKIRETRKIYASTPKAKLINSLRCATKRIAYYSGAKKKFPTVKILGCSFKKAKEYLESKFKDGMSWENYGKWHIDHIRPLTSFDLSDENQQLEAGHYTNLQPLWASENIRKGAKYERSTEKQETAQSAKSNQ
jgi:hypothetical protein